MTADLPLLASANPDAGLWGTSQLNGYDAPLVWRAVSRWLGLVYELAPDEIRDVLDSGFGRHLANDLSRIPGGPASDHAIEGYLAVRLPQRGWKPYLEQTVASLSEE